LERSELLLLLDELLELEPGTMKGSDSLDSFDGWNSLAAVAVLAMADEKFGLSLEPRKMAACQSVNDLLGLFGDRISPEIRG
jgi:acyl carrier protein